MQMPETGDMMCGGDAHIQEKRPGSAATVSACRREWNAVRHTADRKRLDQRLPVGVAPYPARVAADQFLIRGTLCKAVHVRPLPNDAFTVGRLDDRIVSAVPYRDFRPAATMPGCRPHPIAKRLPAMSLRREHELEGFLNITSAPIGQSGNDGPAGKNLRIGCEH